VLTEQLKPADLGGDMVVATIRRVRLRKSQFINERTGAKDLRYVVDFEEFRDRELWLTRGAVTTLVQRYGDETDGWVGQRCPLVVVTVEVKGERHTVVRVAPLKAWT
jgi:hypothetical protein